MTGAVTGPVAGRRAAQAAAWSGLLALQLLIAHGYAVRGTWWHYLLHQLVGQLVSITPDLLFRFARLPHARWMDVFVGHISVHRAPGPVLVAFAVFALGAEAWLVGHYGQGRPSFRRTSTALAVAALLLLTVACLLAKGLPTTLGDYAAT